MRPEELMRHYMPEVRRAGEDLLSPAQAECLARQYAEAKPYKPTRALMRVFEAEVRLWFERIPVRVEWVYDKQPFQTAGQMREHVRKHGCLLMYAAKSVLGELYHKHRAVHDWYGHIVPGISFGLDNELKAYQIHKPMFSAVVHPLIFADVVLNNAYFEVNGEFHPTEKYTLIDDDILRRK